MRHDCQEEEEKWKDRHQAVRLNAMLVACMLQAAVAVSVGGGKRVVLRASRTTSPISARRSGEHKRQ